jgi:ferredoxin-NADP reductase
MWSSYRKFTIESVVVESESAKSFYLLPSDGKSLSPYLPGQHLPIRLRIPGRQPIIRCYTLSDCYSEARYRITIKRGGTMGQSGAPTGLSSTFFHDQLQIGDEIDAKMPTGTFYLDTEQSHPVVLIAGGIGVTPIISMLNALGRSASQRDVYFFFAVRHGGDHVFKTHLRDLCGQISHLHMHVVYGNPRPQDRCQLDYDETGRIDISLLRRLLPTLKDLQYYVCGPSGLMKVIIDGLLTSGVPTTQIHRESFGPSSISIQAAARNESSERLQIIFQRSGVTALWVDDEVKTLLEIGEAHGIDLAYGCRYGDCATCQIPILSGSVEYLHRTGANPDPGTCLPCCCKPTTSVVLDV